MTNIEFLRQYITEVMPKSNVVSGIILATIILIVGIIFAAIGIGFLIDDEWGDLFDRIRHPSPTTVVRDLLLTVVALLGVTGLASAIYMYTLIPQEKADYEAKLAAYNTAVAQAEQMADTRATYKVYLDGTEVNYDTVALANYNVIIDDDKQAIYLTHKEPVTNEENGGTTTILYPVVVPVS